MQPLRSTWWRRGLVALLVTSLLPLVAGRPGSAVSETTTAHEHWLRAQMTPVETLSETARSAVEQAFNRAAASPSPSLAAFTQAFADAYAAQAPPVSLGALFAVPDVGETGLYDVLSQRSAQLGRAAVLPRLTIGPAPTTAASGRFVAAAGTAPVPALSLRQQSVAVGMATGRLVPCLIRTLFSARPMAP